jgi:D-alanyl-D-alanine carboxypeptidase/D-alanyl-D-alanine-endopeptidase (penicillin-binding protein 4)
MRQALARLGIDLSGSTFYDGSGLARRDALPVRVLLDVLQLAADPGQPGLRTVVSSLPVAGFTGSLASRFVQDAPAGLGAVRAKTGTLTGVHGLGGLVVTRSGHGFVFAAVANDVPIRRALAARAQLDSIAALLATCRCAR